MSDEEEDIGEEEEVEAEEAPKPEEAAPVEEPQEEEEPEEPVKQEEEKPKPKPPPPRKFEDEDAPKEMTEAERVMAAQRKKHDEEEAMKMLNYEEKRRIEKEKEDEDLRALKEKQARRQQEREEEEKLLAERRREEEERRKADEEARKAKAEEIKARKDEEKKKRLAAMQGLQQTAITLDIPKKDPKDDKFDKFGNVVKKVEKKETKEEHEQNKAKHMKSVVGEPNFSGMNLVDLKKRVTDMHARISKLEAARYDLEKRTDRQEYDLKELNERQRQMHRNKALKKGLDPDEAANTRHPPKMPTASKYDRQKDRRSYGDRRTLFESDKTKKPKSIFHGSVRPPSEWGRHESEELEQLRKNMEPAKYVEVVKIEGAKPPMSPVPAQPPPPDEE